MPHPALTVVALVLLIAGASLWGWWLAAFGAPAPVVAISGLLLAYGLAVGWGGLVPVNGAIAAAIAVVVAFDQFPAFWPAHVHYKYWAATVLLLWLSGGGVACLVTAVGQRLRSQPAAYRWGGVALVLTSLLLAKGLGRWLYQIQWPGWVPWP